MKVSSFYSVSKSAVPFVLGLFFFIYSSRLSFGSLSNPGPGLWPMSLSAIIMLISILLFFSKEKSEEDESFTGDSRNSLYGVMSLAFFILLFENIGLTLSCLGVFLFWIRFLGKERWTISIVISMGLTSVIYGIFAWGLNIPFPEDKLFFLFN